MFYPDPNNWGDEDCWGRLLIEARGRAEKRGRKLRAVVAGFEEGHWGSGPPAGLGLGSTVTSTAGLYLVYEKLTFQMY